MKEYIEKELQNKAEAYCSSVERCPSDVEAKLKGWGASPETLAAVMAHLFKEKYLDTVRFCSAYVRDKYRFNQWGRMKKDCSDLSDEQTKRVEQTVKRSGSKVTAHILYALRDGLDADTFARCMDILEEKDG